MGFAIASADLLFLHSDGVGAVREDQIALYSRMGQICEPLIISSKEKSASLGLHQSWHHEFEMFPPIAQTGNCEEECPKAVTTHLVTSYDILWQPKQPTTSLGSRYVSGETAHLPLPKPNINTYFSPWVKF